MNEFFLCENGQNLPWKFVCDGRNQCFDGSDEEHCTAFLRFSFMQNSPLFLGFCQGDIYPCLQGNNVSCRLACATYGRVTCITYQNTRACEQYNMRVVHGNASNDSLIFPNYLDAFQYSVCLAIGTLLVLTIFFILIYLVRKKLFRFLFPCTDVEFDQQTSYLRYTPTADTLDFQGPCPYCEQYTIANEEAYEPPPYPGSSIFPSLARSNSIYYETIKTPTMSMLNSLSFPEPFVLSNIRTHSV